MRCLACGHGLDPVNAEYGTHPACDMKLQPVDEDEDPFVSTLKHRIIDMVRWNSQQHPRKKQVRIGPSEIGTLCDRRIGYRLAEVPEHNTGFDPWPSIVGTAVHSWLETAVTSWMTAHGSSDWRTEETLVIEEFVEGHADLYSHEFRSVIDYKTVGPDIMRKIKKDGAPLGYQIQAHVYGYGFEKIGLPVERVCLAFMPRAGWLKDMYVWCANYSQELAKTAIARLQMIAQQILSVDTLTYPDRWKSIEAVPSNDCAWCPWYNPRHENDADADGCPGR